MARTTVGVLRGGTSSEYNLSLKTGAKMLSELPEEKYDTRDIFIDKGGTWHLRGIPASPARALSQVDVVLNALHGGIGEDGTVQRILHRFGVPYAGSTAHASAVSHNKVLARNAMQKAGIRIPRGISFTVNDPLNTAEMAKAVHAQFAPPYVVKPIQEGSGYGIRIAPNIIELSHAIGDVLDAYGAALIEEFMIGEQATAFILENFRKEDLYAFPPVHTVLPQGEKWMHPRVHEENLARHVAPSNFTHEDKQAIAELARQVHRALQLSHFSVVGFILTSRGPFVIEVDLVPPLHHASPLHAAFESVGSSVREFLEHAIYLARR